MAKRLTLDNVIDVLLEQVPELLVVYRRLLTYYGLPIDPYWLVGEAASFAYELARATRNLDTTAPHAADTLRRLMGVLEQIAASDDIAVSNLTGVGFVERLNPDDPCFDDLLRLMGPESRKYITTVFGPSWLKHPKA